jgi:hypothetical protein
MIDYVGRDGHKPRTQVRHKNVTPLAEKAKFVAVAFPIVFTVIFILNQILEHASRHG